MATHNAPGQMLGYLYQVCFALNLLMESDDPSYQISLEKFDDIAFDKDGAPIQLIQTKHHTTPASLSDSSTDLWRTLKAWLDTITDDNSLLNHTDFVIITTATAPEDSAAKLIQQENYHDAFEKLKMVASTSPNQTNLSFYQKFNSIDDLVLLRLIKRIKIVSSAGSIDEIEKRIQKQIRIACKPEHVSMATERIEGWWLQKCIKALCSTDPIITTQRQLHAKVYEITRQFGDDNLPIEFWELDILAKKQKWWKAIFHPLRLYLSISRNLLSVNIVLSQSPRMSPATHFQALLSSLHSSL